MRDLPGPPPPRLARLADRLSRLGFHEDVVADRLQVSSIPAIHGWRYPLYRARLAREPDELAALIDLLLLRGEVTRAALGRALGRRLLEDLAAGGLLRLDGERAIARAHIFPCRGAFLATDLRYGGRRPVRDPAPYLGSGSYALARYLVATPSAGRVLDLATGSGVHAIVAAAESRHPVIGVDVSRRALRFARWNAALNRARCDFRHGDLYGALHPAERFDRIVAAPPFLPDLRPPGRAAPSAARAVGELGDDVARRVVLGLPTWLAPTGEAILVTAVVERAHQHPEDELRRWLGDYDRVAGLDITLHRLASRTVEDHAAFHCEPDPYADTLASYEARYRGWVEALHRVGVTAIHQGLLVVRRSSRPRVRVTEDPPWGASSAG